MIRTILETKSGFRWIDLVDPTVEELTQIAEQYKLHSTSVQDCLSPEHLPKYEQIEETLFILLRYADQEACRVADSDTIQELTRKVAVFLGPQFLISVHRAVAPFLAPIEKKWLQKPGPKEDLGARLTIDIVRAAVLSYEAPLQEGEHAFEAFEMLVLGNQAGPLLLEELYFLKRKVGVYKRMLRYTLDVVFKISAEAKKSPYLQDLREEAERVHAHSEELIDDVSHLLNTHISLASHRTNEIVRVLTLFSVFFMPLTFLVGVYGMNFTHMPELTWKYGYPSVWALMTLIAVGIFVWFRKRHWL